MLTTRVLGPPRGDTSLLVTVNTGQAVHRLLLDCGAGWSGRLRHREVLTIQHVFISHFHIDHMIGFDVLLRVNMGQDRQLDVWGPPQTIELVQHRLRGYIWNLVADSNLAFRCHDVGPDRITTATLLCREGFAQVRDLSSTPHDGTILDHPDFRVRAALLDHAIPVLALAIEEPDRWNVDVQVLQRQGWTPGPWVAKVKDLTLAGTTVIAVADRTYTLADLRRLLLKRTPGKRMAFVTDTILNAATEARIERLARGVDELYCEASFLEADAHLAVEHRHMTARQVGLLARRLGVGRLVLIHPSDRYPNAGVLVQEAAAEFPRTRAPRWTRPEREGR